MTKTLALIGALLPVAFALVVLSIVWKVIGWASGVA